MSDGTVLFVIGTLPDVTDKVMQLEDLTGAPREQPARFV